MSPFVNFLVKLGIGYTKGNTFGYTVKNDACMCLIWFGYTKAGTKHTDVSGFRYLIQALKCRF